MQLLLSLTWTHPSGQSLRSYCRSWFPSVPFSTLVVSWQSRWPTRTVNNVLFKKWKWLLCRLKYSHSLYSLQWLCRWLFLLVVFSWPPLFFVFCFLFFWVLEGFIRYFCFLGKRQMQSHINGADWSRLWSVGHWWCAQVQIIRDMSSELCTETLSSFLPII